ncbi:MAG: cyclopropane-fatty-acyl-phospholipid synthase [Campylobacterales bacterium]
MKGFWNRFGHRFLSGITQGDLTVIYPDGTQARYGNGLAPRAMLDLHDGAMFRRIALFGDIGFAESYIDGDFDVDDLTALIALALINSQTLQTRSEDERRLSLYNLMPHFNRIKHLLRKNSKTRSQKNIAKHYDLSNEFFTLMLDETMMYSSAVFKDADEPLHLAQQRKISLLADKLRLRPGAKVLEIGSGWGSMALHLAKERGCAVTTVTLSQEQKALCEARFKAHDVEGSVDIMLRDYRDLEGSFDAIIAVEMFEAVGREYFDVFFRKCESLLAENGVLVMQVITMPDQRYDAYCKGTDFIQKYIFPGGHLPSVAKILETTSRHTRLNLQHMEEFTEDYAKTLDIWHENFNRRIAEVKALGFDDDFVRMWRMYLCYCTAAFLTRNINLVQLAFTRDQNLHLNKGLVA